MRLVSAWDIIVLAYTTQITAKTHIYTQLKRGRQIFKRPVKCIVSSKNTDYDIKKTINHIEK